MGCSCLQLRGLLFSDRHGEQQIRGDRRIEGLEGRFRQSFVGALSSREFYIAHHASRITLGITTLKQVIASRTWKLHLSRIALYCTTMASKGSAVLSLNRPCNKHHIIENSISSLLCAIVSPGPARTALPSAYQIVFPIKSSKPRWRVNQSFSIALPSST